VYNRAVTTIKQGAGGGKKQRKKAAISAHQFSQDLAFNFSSGWEKLTAG
jgi:hypothetical protein